MTWWGKEGAVGQLSNFITQQTALNALFLGGSSINSFASRMALTGLVNSKSIATIERIYLT